MRRALEERGLEHDQHLHLLVGEVNLPHYYPPFIDDSMATLPEDSETLRYLQQYLREHPEITAIVAQNDVVAQEIYYSFRYLGINILDDYSLMGYDDTCSIVNAYGANVLTTIHLPLSEIGRRAAQLLVSLIKDESPAASSIALPTTLVVRNSTVPPRDGATTA
jgi:DNA-binding LacI/PurR family transcriptional regulator